MTAVVDEIWIQDDSTTRKICAEFLRRYREHPGLVYLYGDPAGGARGTAQDGNDWSIVRGLLKPVFGKNLKDRVAKGHPSIRGSVNAVDKRLRTYAGEIHMLLSSRCKHTRTDFEGTTWSLIETPEGKKKAGDLTHLTDAIPVLRGGEVAGAGRGVAGGAGLCSRLRWGRMNSARRRVVE